MSGDAQTRKRKDKKRKKDDSTEQIPLQFTSTPPASNLNEQDINIHVHKEGGTGGGICAKIVFFLLFTALAVLIGLIITEHRGLTDLDAVDNTESRFSQIFEGWIDDSPPHADDHDEEAEHLSNSLELEEEDEEHDSHDVEHDEHHDDDDDEGEDEPDEQTLESEDEEDNDNDEDEDEDEDEEDGADNDENDEEDELDNEMVSKEVEDEDDNDNDYEEEDDEPESKNIEESEEQNDEDDEDADKEITHSVDEDEDEDNDHSNEQPQSQEQDENEDDIDNDSQEDNDIEEEIPKPKAVEQKEETIPDENSDNSRKVNVDDNNEIEESDSDAGYDYENITNKDDWQVKDDIDSAQQHVQDNPAYALKLFDALLKQIPKSPRILYGKAQSLDLLADKKRSNVLLQNAIQLYLQILDLEDVPNALYQTVADRCINRCRFIGYYNRAIQVHKKLIARFQDVVKYRNQLAVTFLTTNQVNEARDLLKETLEKYPNDGFALVHYGFVLKTADNNLNESIDFMARGLATGDEGVQDGRFYFHLGDALARTGQQNQAMEVYEKGVQAKVFLSKYQRSLYNVNHLKAQPWWHKDETPYKAFFAMLENHWQEIRAEGLSVLSKDGLFLAEAENLKDTGDWKQFELFSRGRKQVENCKKCPVTCGIVENLPEAKGCRRGQTKFSVIHPGTHVWPHCGPTNCRLRVHLGLKVPPDTYIRVAQETRTWNEGEVLIFDDSFEHEVWHNGTTLRLVLIVDVWHPELTMEEKRSLSAI